MGTTDSLPASTAIGRVSLTVADLDAVAQFYETVVGLAVHDRTSDRVVMGDGEMSLLELVCDPDAPERSRSVAGLFHTAFRVPSRTALGAALERIESHTELSGASDHHVSEALYLSDPEGNGIEIYWDRPRSEWPESADGRVQMDTLRLPVNELRAASDGSRSVPRGTDIGHVHLEVTDLAAARSFYVDTVGLGVRQEMRGALFVAAGDYHHHVGANVWNRRSEPARGRGLAWFELLVPDEATLSAVRERVDAAGYETSDVAGGFTAVDGDGISIRFGVTHEEMTTDG